MESYGISVFLYKGEETSGTTIEIPVEETLTSEDVCVIIGKKLKFRPISICLFGLRLKKSDIWFPNCFTFEKKKVYSIEFRLRFRLPSLYYLSKIDDNAFDYVFHQIRYEIINGGIPELLQDQIKKSTVGLCVTDMLRAIEEDKISKEKIVSNYKHYVPKKICKDHRFYLKSKIEQSLDKLISSGGERSKNTLYMKQMYVNRVEDLAPNYLTEEFNAMTFKEGEYPATIRVNQFDKTQPGISILYIGKHEWEHLCTIQELCFISIRSESSDAGTAEISRKNGVPISVKFKTLDLLHTFISLLDGYYRLTEKWTFNLCNELPSISLAKLKILKCHGPVGEKFAHKKLSTHLNTKPGSFIIRQSSKKFDEYVIDFILHNKDRPMSRDVLLTNENKYKLDNHVLEFTTLPELISNFLNNPESDFSITDCLPPSEYDISPLLLSRKPDQKEIGLQESQESTTGPPQLISARDLQIFKGKKFELEGKFCKVWKAIWKQNKKTNVNVAVKFLKREHEDRYMKEFLEMADKCVLWQCESLVALRGIILGSPQALILDWMPFGRLDDYLKENSLRSRSVEVVELIEAASHIARALLFLEDHGIVHGNIRCHNIFVYEHSDEMFLCKLADPSIYEFSPYDVHWIAPELFDVPSLAKSMSRADVYAYGTTLWEIFSNGKRPPEELPAYGYKMKYTSGWRLAKPNKCSFEIFRIMRECWAQNPIDRKSPQVIVRDIHQIFYQLSQKKRVHAYTTLTPTSSEGSRSQMNGGFDISSDLNWTTFGSGDQQGNANTSDGTVITFLNSGGGSYHSGSTKLTWLQDTNSNKSSYWHDIFPKESDYSTGSIAQGIYVFGKDQLTLGKIIGEGCYGAVFMGDLLKDDGYSEQVAVKKLKEGQYLSKDEQNDFYREFEILKGLSHANIVEVKGVVYDPELLLIMEYLPNGSILDHFKTCCTKPDFKQLIKFVRDVAEGMAYLSSNSIVHRDLAARNILVAIDGVKISDFGLARSTGMDNSYTLRTNRKLPLKWYPPESIKHGKFSEQSDVWSFGVTAFEIFTYGKEPNLPGIKPDDDDIDEIIKFLNQGIRLPCPDNCPIVVYTQLMFSCWRIKPSERPNFKKILSEIIEIERQLF